MVSRNYQEGAGQSQEAISQQQPSHAVAPSGEIPNTHPSAEYQSQLVVVDEGQEEVETPGPGAYNVEARHTGFKKSLKDEKY